MASIARAVLKIQVHHSFSFLRLMISINRPLLCFCQKMIHPNQAFQKANNTETSVSSKSSRLTVDTSVGVVIAEMRWMQKCSFSKQTNLIPCWNLNLENSQHDYYLHSMQLNQMPFKKV